MAKQPTQEPVLLRWSKHVPSSDVQDPLGLSLRGSSRLATRLLHCITSITPRARYFSFIPWCIRDFGKREKGKPWAAGLADAIAYREHALVLGSIAHHDGAPCAGGRLVGSDKAATWFETQRKSRVDFTRTRFVKYPALNAYFNSLVNLGVFVADDELPETDEEQETDRSFEDIELSPLGLELAERYETAIGELAGVRQIASRERECSLAALKEWGKRGCLCELSRRDAPDRRLLRDIFFRLCDLKGEAHKTRRQSLLLMLELCRQLSAKKQPLDHSTFCDAVYSSEVPLERGSLRIALPDVLDDVASRWRMFYFHHYMAVALEGMFSWLVTELGGIGLKGASVDSLVSRLAQRVVASDLSECLHCDVSSAQSLTPARLLGLFGVPQGPLTPEVSDAIERSIRPASPISEPSIEELIRNGTYLHSATGLALPAILLAVTLGRYKRWETTNYGKWLATAVQDPYLDLIPPVLVGGLERRFGDWWNCSLKNLTEAVLSRYVIETHRSMSYEKSYAGERCLLQVDGSRVYASGGAYDQVGIRNARLDSALQILMDLRLMSEDDGSDILTLTQEGRRFLEEQLSKEAGA